MHRDIAWCRQVRRSFLIDLFNDGPFILDFLRMSRETSPLIVCEYRDT